MLHSKGSEIKNHHLPTSKPKGDPSPFPFLSKPCLLSLPTMYSGVSSSYKMSTPLFKIIIVLINFQEVKPGAESLPNKLPQEKVEITFPGKPLSSAHTKLPEPSLLHTVSLVSFLLCPFLPLFYLGSPLPGDKLEKYTGSGKISNLHEFPGLNSPLVKTWDIPCEKLTLISHKNDLNSHCIILSFTFLPLRLKIP